MVGMVGTGGYGYLYGDVWKLITPWDFDGNGCGLDKYPTKDYPYLYWPSIDATFLAEADPKFDVKSLNKLLAYSYCVKKCPSGDPTEPIVCKKVSFI